MATYSEKMFFNEKIDGKTIKDFRKLDTKKKSLSERKEILEQKLESSDFFVQYFDEVYNPNLTASDSLADSDVVCQTLENMGTYLINCEESKMIDKKEKEEDDHNKIFTQRLDKYINRESVNMKDFEGNNVNIVESERVDFKKPSNTIVNEMKPKVQTITEKDLKEDSKMGEILRDYKVFLDVIDDKMKQKINNQWFLLSKHKSSVKQDMIDVKNMLKGVWGYNINPQFSPKLGLYDDNIFDFTDRNTIKYLLKIEKPDIENDLTMWIVWHEFHDTVEKADLTDEERTVYDLLKFGLDFKEIANVTDIDYDRARKNVFNNICTKIERVKNYYDADNFEIAEKIKKRKEKNMKNGGNAVDARV